MVAARTCSPSSKAASDYAEVFDGVPSQHDGKDAAVVAELAAIGKSRPWPCETASATPSPSTPKYSDVRPLANRVL